jgi:hypothetical protein
MSGSSSSGSSSSSLSSSSSSDGSSSGSSDSETSSLSSGSSSSSIEEKGATTALPISSIPGAVEETPKETERSPYISIAEDFPEVDDFLPPRGAFLPNIKAIAEKSKSRRQGYAFSALASLDPEADTPPPIVATDLFERFSTVGEIKLLADEVPLQVEWLSLPWNANASWLDGSILEGGNASETHKTNPPFKYIGAIVTTLRILIVSSSLSILNEVHRNSHPSLTFSPLSYFSNSIPFFTSCMWVGLNFLVFD